MSLSFNAASVSQAPSKHSPGNEPMAHTSLSTTIVRTGNSPQAMGCLNAVDALLSPLSNTDIPSPVLVRGTFTSSVMDFIDQTDLDYKWASFIDEMNKRPLTESGAVAVVRSGVLLREPCKALAEDFVDWVLRSIRPIGALTEDHLDEIVNVVCHLPDSQWQAALGENIRFLSGRKLGGLAELIQSKLDRSNALQREMIANGEWLADVHWNALMKLTIEGRQYIGPNDGELNSDMLMLEDASEVRPTPIDAFALLEDLIRHLEKENVSKLPWTECYLIEVKGLLDQIKPGEEKEPGWLEWLVGPSWLESLLGRPVWPSAPMNTTPLEVRSATSVDDPAWPLSAMLAFELNGDSYKSVATNRQSLGKSVSDILLQVSNVMKNVGATWSDGRFNPIGRPAPEPSSRAWKNGPHDISRAPLEPKATVTDPLTTLGHYVAQADALVDQFVNKVLPWNSVQASSENSIAVPLGAAAGLIAYGVASTLVTHQLLPEAEEMIDPAQGLESSLDVAPDKEEVIHEYIVDRVEDLLANLPVFANALQKRTSESEFLDPCDDPLLLEDIDTMLQQFVPGLDHVTYQAYFDEFIELAYLEAREELEDHTDSGSTPPSGSIPEADDGAVGGSRKKRSLRLDNERAQVQTFGSSVQPKTANLLVEASRPAMEADASGNSDKLLAPGMTYGQAAEQCVDILLDLQAVMDPVLYIDTVVDGIIADSNLPEKVKATLDSKTIFRVTYQRMEGTNTPRVVTRHQSFSLGELFAGQHEKNKKSDESVFISWPRSFTSAFISKVSETDIYALFVAKVEGLLSTPVIFQSWKQARTGELNRSVKAYLNGTQCSTEGKETARRFLDNQVKPRTIAIRDGALSKPDVVSNAVYLPGKGKFGGLFIFLGQNNTVIEHPPELLLRMKSIEQFSELSELLSSRISLKELLGRDPLDFKYSLGHMSVTSERWDFLHALNPLTQMFSSYSNTEVKVPYEPILFGWEDSEQEPIFEELLKRLLDQLKIAMDMLTSTSAERMTDAILEGVSYLLAILSMGAALVPGGGFITVGLSVLFGLASSAATFARGELEDDPVLAAQHRASALLGAAFELAGPFVARLIGKPLSASQKYRIHNEVTRRLASSGRLPKGVAEHFPKPTPRKIPKRNNRQIGWVPDKKMSSGRVSSKVTHRFVRHHIVEKIVNLERGPQVAQRLMDSTGFNYFAGPEKGYVYRGIVMRGDMRDPTTVFSEGFKLRQPIKDIKEVNGMRGGFGGGKDQLDPDGKGISTSAFYKDSGAGAYQYGGGRGGWTYLIDGRDMDGYHLYRNNNYAKHPQSRIGFKAWEINYGQDIPSSKILGAYDSAGKFHPNEAAIQRSINLSTPSSPLGAIPKVYSSNANNGTHIG